MEFEDPLANCYCTNTSLLVTSGSIQIRPPFTCRKRMEATSRYTSWTVYYYETKVQLKMQRQVVNMTRKESA